VPGLKPVSVDGDRVRRPDRDILADELAATANCRGGTVVPGVDDQSRAIHGIHLDDLDAVMAAIPPPETSLGDAPANVEIRFGQHRCSNSCAGQLLQPLQTFLIWNT